MSDHPPYCSPSCASIREDHLPCDCGAIAAAERWQQPTPRPSPEEVLRQAWDEWQDSRAVDLPDGWDYYDLAIDALTAAGYRIVPDDERTVADPEVERWQRIATTLLVNLGDRRWSEGLRLCFSSDDWRALTEAMPASPADDKGEQ